MRDQYEEKKVVPSITKDPYVIDFTVDLTKIKGDGGFPCPKCRNPISPDDTTEDNYTIVKTEVKDDELAEVVVQCNRCGKYTKMTGFLSSPESKVESETV